MPAKQKPPVYGKGSLLLANGSLEDPNFKRTVVLLCEHNDKGSFGLVLSRPLKVTLAEAFSENALLRKDTTPLFYGGPCDENRIQWLHNAPDRVPDSFMITEDVAMGGDFESLVRLIKEEPGILQARFFLGYSGWGEGQLDSEMEQKSWIVSPAKQEWVFPEVNDAQSLWQTILEGMGEYYSFLSRMPFDVRMN